MIKLSELLPASQRWLEAKGYASRCIEDGEAVYSWTPAGLDYLARITTGEKNAVGNQTKSDNSTTHHSA